jgi:internalin A
VTSAPEPLETPARPTWYRWAILAGLLLAIAAGLAAWLRAGQQSAASELAAKAELADLGALVVMDSQRKHVSSVNLSTLKSPATMDQAVAVLPALGRLNSLNADHTTFGDKHAAIVGQLSNLEDLVLSHTAITDAALEQLQGLSHLKSIHLADTAVTNAGLNSLGRLRSLNIIDLSGTKVTGNFDPLRNVTSLNWLVARRLTLDAAALAAVAACPSLTRLTLNDAICPPNALKELTDKKPDLTIDQ